MAAPSGTESDLWIRRFHPSRGSGSRLLCLPQAGGSASFYFPISAAMAPDVEVLAVQYPGRQDRRTEPSLESSDALADEIFRVVSRLVDRPLALFGHSMGAVIAFELARRLQRAGRPPAVLFASGRRGPSRQRMETIHQRDDAELVRHVKALGGTDTALLDDEEVLSMILPALRSDYRAVETYRRAPGDPLNCPIVAMIGDADPMVTMDEARAWSEETTAAFELEILPGGHFYLVQQQRAVVGRVTECLKKFAGQRVRGEDR